MKSTFSLSITMGIIGLFWSVTAWAMTLQEAKTNRIVGEQPNGYLGIVIDSPEAQQLVLTVNKKRKEHYQAIAQRNNISLEKVATLAAKKAMQAAEPGHMIQTPQGQWLKK
ncbi:YdbL family protein [Shewanella sp. A14]